MRKFLLLFFALNGEDLYGCLFCSYKFETSDNTVFAFYESDAVLYNNL